MRLRATRSGDLAGDLERIMAAEIAGAESAVTRSMARAGSGLQKDWRDQIRTAGLGRRLSRTIRRRVYPEGEQSVKAAALVWTKAPKIIAGFEEGALIRAKDGFWLAIPIDPAARRMRGPNNKKVTPGLWEQRTGRRLEFIYRKGRPPLLVDTGIPLARERHDRLDFRTSRYRRWTRGGRRRGRTWTPIFVLLPQVKLRKRLDIDRLARKWQGLLPGMIVRNWPDIGGGP